MQERVFILGKIQFMLLSYRARTKLILDERLQNTLKSLHIKLHKTCLNGEVIKVIPQLSRDTDLIHGLTRVCYLHLQQKSIMIMLNTG